MSGRARARITPQDTLSTINPGPNVDLINVPVARRFTGAFTRAGAVTFVRGNLGTTGSADWAPFAFSRLRPSGRRSSLFPRTFGGSEMALTALREEIDSIDRELVRLLDRRAQIAREVGRSKAVTGMSTFDPGRAKAVILQAVSRSTGDFPRAGLEYVFREVLSACLNLQKPLRVGFLGPKDSFTNQAAIREFGSSVDFTSFKLIRDVFAAVEQQKIDYGVVPIENSTGGTVHLTLDAFIEHPVSVCSEVLLPIHHSLLGTCQMADVRRVYSHPQAFLQCERWLEQNLPNAQRIEVDSTTQGMVEASRDEHGAAIGSDSAAEQYGLHILARYIQDSSDNTTRFLVISQNDSRPCGDDKTSIMFSVKDRPGTLIRVLRPFEELGINLSKLESRPTKRRAWEQAFFVDAAGHRESPLLQQAIERIKPECESLRILGSYPREKSPSEVEEIQRLAIAERNRLEAERNLHEAERNRHEGERS